MITLRRLVELREFVKHSEQICACGSVEIITELLDGFVSLRTATAECVEQLQERVLREDLGKK